MRILVADDSKTNLTLITSALINLGHEVIAVASGAEAVEMFLDQTPDLVILDVVMQGMNGFECAKQIRNRHTDGWIPIIFLSGSVDDTSISQGIDAGGDDYLSKPFSAITLAAKIKAMQRISDMRKKLYDATQQLTVLSSTDTLSGLYNRFQFNKIIKEQICYAKRKNTKFALFYIDLDKFKNVNDSLGHPVGDSLLVESSKRLRNCIRGYDFLARIGGDEFALIANDIDSENMTCAIAEKIVSNLAEPFDLAGREIKISCSIGITYYPDDALTEEALLQNADIAMYEAKESGRNNYKYFNKEHAKKNCEKKIELLTEQITTPNENPNNFFVLNCLVNSTNICIDLVSVVKIIPLAQLVEIPNSPYYLVGMLNLAGKSVPVIDLSARLNLQRYHRYSLETPIIICQDFIDLQEQSEIGLIVDKILDINEINPASIQNSDYEDKSSYFLANIILPTGLSFLLNIPNILEVNLAHAANKKEASL